MHGRTGRTADRVDKPTNGVDLFRLAPAWVIRAWFHGYQHLGNYGPEDRVDAARFYAEAMSDQEWRARQYVQVMGIRSGYVALEIATAQADNDAMQGILRNIVKDAQALLEKLDYSTEEK